MTRLTAVGAMSLAVTAIGMMLFVMNTHNTLPVRWGAFIIAAAAVVVLALSYRSLLRAHEQLRGSAPGSHSDDSIT